MMLSRLIARPARQLTVLIIMGVVAFMPGACSSEQESEIQISALHFFKQGNQAFAAEDYHRAIRHYRRVLVLDDQAAAAHYNLGLALYKMQAYSESALAFERSLSVDPDQPAAHYNLALTYDRLYQMPEAHSHYNKYRSMAAQQQSGGANGPATISATPTRTRQRAGGKLPDRTVVRQTSARRSLQAGNPVLAAAQAKNNQRQKQRSPGRTRAAESRKRESGGTLGDSNKWWIQDRFIQNQ